MRYNYTSDDILQQIVCADPTLTVESLVGVMKKVSSLEEKRRKVWEEVFRFDYSHMNTPIPYVDEVYTKCTSNEERTLALADAYINSSPESSWQHLVKTLYSEGELPAAKEAKPFLQQNGK